LTDPDPAADARTEPETPESARIVERLEEVVRDAGLEEEPLPVEDVRESDDLDGAWRALGSLHQRVDEWREEDRISLTGARELRARLLELSRALAEEAVRNEASTCRQLLRDVSHDIRSPLHSIIFLAEAMYSGRTGSLSESDRRQLGTIYAASTSLLNLVNDLLDYARMAPGEVDEVAEMSFTVGGVMADVRHLLAPLVEHYGTDYSVRTPRDDHFIGDPQLLCRLLTNLVSNAIEASGREGEVRVEIAPADGGLKVQVEDDGGAANVSRMEGLLSGPEGESLTNSAGEKRRGRTHGLGLLISGRLLEAAGGWAEAERVDSGPAGSGEQSSGGTRIRVWLPFPKSSRES